MSNISLLPLKMKLDHFFQRLRHVRDVRGYTQSELAARAGLQPSAIAHFESGSRLPSFDNLSKLSAALSCTADFLLGHSPSPSQHWEDPIFKCIQELASQDREYVTIIVEALARRQGDRTVSAPRNTSVEP